MIQQKEGLQGIPNSRWRQEEKAAKTAAGILKMTRNAQVKQVKRVAKIVAATVVWNRQLMIEKWVAYPF